MKPVTQKNKSLVEVPSVPQSREGLRLLRIREVLKRYPVSRAAWYRGMRDGRFPSSVSLGDRSVAWRESDIDALIASAK